VHLVDFIIRIYNNQKKVFRFVNLRITGLIFILNITVHSRDFMILLMTNFKDLLTFFIC